MYELSECQLPEEELVRPPRTNEAAVPPIPVVDPSPDQASVQYSHYRTKLSNHRTALSEHRTALSEYRHQPVNASNQPLDQPYEMSMRRTGMSFQRTRLSADRTLMSVIRTSLSLISFGFTIFQFFHKLQESNVLASASAPRNFGTTLVGLGIVMLLFGIVYHVQFMSGLRAERSRMTSGGLIHGESAYPVSLSLISAIILLIIGVLALASMFL